MYHQIYDAGRLTSDLCSLTDSAWAGSSTVREHSADIRETVVRLHLGLLATIRREMVCPLPRGTETMHPHLASREELRHSKRKPAIDS